MESVSEQGLDSAPLTILDGLHIPRSKQEELQQQYPSTSHRRRAYSTYYLTHHPAPSWQIVATALYDVKEMGALEVVQKLYLKGELCADSCRCERKLAAVYHAYGGLTLLLCVCVCVFVYMRVVICNNTASTYYLQTKLCYVLLRAHIRVTITYGQIQEWVQ